MDHKGNNLKYLRVTAYSHCPIIPTTKGQKKSVSLLLSFSRYSISSSDVMTISSTEAVMNRGLEPRAKDTRATHRVT